MAIKPFPARVHVLIGKFFDKEILQWFDVFRKSHDGLDSGNLLVQTDSDTNLTEVDDLTDWIASTDGHLTVTDDGDGSVTIDLEDVWEDLRFPAAAVKVGSAKPPTWTAYKGGLILAFGDEAVEGNEERIHFVAQMPHAYKEGSDLEFHVHWVPEDATTGNVRWKFSYSWANIGATFPGETTIYVNDAAPGEADHHELAGFATIDGTGKTISSMLICTLQRNSSDALDTFNGKSAYFLEADFHIELDTLGSRQETSK